MEHVTRRTVMTAHSKPGPAAGGDWFAWLIDPLSPADFERDCYEQQHAHIRRQAPRYYADLLSVGDLDVVLGTHSAGHADIKLVRSDGDVPLGEYTDSAGRVQPLDVARHFDAGATIIFNQLHRRVPALSRLCAALGQRFSSRVQTNVYLTPPAAQGFAPHWDTHDVFVLQVSGAKQWSIYDTRVRLPLPGQRFERGTPPGEVSDEFELGPGSAAYLPRGLLHAARSTRQASLHVTLGLTAFTWADLLVEAVSAAALEDESLRRNLPREFAREEFPAAERERLCREKLALAASRLDPQVVWRRFADEVLAANPPLFTDLLGQRLAGDALTARSRVKRRAGLATEARTEGGMCILHFCGRELRLPAGVWPALQFAVTRAEFAAEDLPDCLDAEGKLTLVTRLVREGVLQRS